MGGGIAVTLVILLFGWRANAKQPAAKFPEADQALAEVAAEIEAADARFNGLHALRDKEWVKRRLEHLHRVDMTARSAYIRRPANWTLEARQYFQQKLGARIAAIERDQTAELKELLAHYGWFTISLFGEKADACAWLIVLHSDFDVAFQQRVLDMLTALVPKRETNARNYAHLWDRVARNTGKLQRYGTEGHCIAPGHWQPYEVEDPAGLNQRRAALGLPTIEEYTRLMNQQAYCP